MIHDAGRFLSFFSFFFVSSLQKRSEGGCLILAGGRGAMVDWLV